MSDTFYRETWAEINLDAIEANVQNLKKHLPNTTQIMAVVKADGYGHGAVETAKAALEAGATWLGVALLDEAIALRQAGIDAPVLVFGWTRPSDVPIAVRHHISLMVYQKEWIIEASKNYKGHEPVFLHIKIDTGMARLGVRTREEMAGLVTALKEDKRMIAEGVFTHFATADETNTAHYDMQYGRFTDMLEYLQTLDVNPNLIHCGNSAAALKYPEKMFSMVRFGISLYGLSPSNEMKPSLPFELKPAFALYSRLIHVKEIERGEKVGYGATYAAVDKMIIGTVPIGYADGWRRKLSGKASVLIKGKRCPIVGRICMDQMMVALDKKYSVGEKVALIGESDGAKITTDEIADYLETITHEITCVISKRVPRIYLKNGKIIHTSNPILI